jgi:hypothetical protein
MFKHIIGQATIQLAVLMVLLFSAQRFIYETQPVMINYGYQFTRCFDWSVIPHSPILYHHGDLEDKDMYLITGFQSLFANSDNSAFTGLPGCQETFPDITNIKQAYHHFISVIFN